jgi:hypothetical protein
MAMDNNETDEVLDDSSDLDFASASRFEVRDYFRAANEKESAEREADVAFRSVFESLQRTLTPALTAEVFLSQSDFEHRFRESLARLSGEKDIKLPDELQRQLYQLAQDALSMKQNWNFAVASVRERYEPTRRLLCTALELLNVVTLPENFGEYPASNETELWVTSQLSRFDQLRRKLAKEVSSGIASIEDLAFLQKSGRSQVESTVLCIVNDRLKGIVKGSPLFGKVSFARAAFCDAVGLIRDPRNRDKVADFTALVSSRIDRAKHSKEVARVISTILRMNAIQTTSDSGHFRAEAGLEPEEPR